MANPQDLIVLDKNRSGFGCIDFDSRRGAHSCPVCHSRSVSISMDDCGGDRGSTA
jgi:hypothetical protein